MSEISKIIAKRGYDKTNTTTVQIELFVKKVKDGDWILQPEYQREFVWNKSKQQKLLHSVIHGIPIQPVILSTRESEEKGKYLVCMDGQQRLTTIYKFMTGEIPYKYNGYNYWVDSEGKEKENITGTKDRWLTKADVKNLNLKEFPQVAYTDLTLEQERELFQTLQLSQMLTPDELLHALGDSSSIMVSIGNIVEKLHKNKELFSIRHSNRKTCYYQLAYFLLKTIVLGKLQKTFNYETDMNIVMSKDDIDLEKWKKAESHLLLFIDYLIVKLKTHKTRLYKKNIILQSVFLLYENKISDFDQLILNESSSITKEEINDFISRIKSSSTVTSLKSLIKEISLKLKNVSELKGYLDMKKIDLPFWQSNCIKLLSNYLEVMYGDSE